MWRGATGQERRGGPWQTIQGEGQNPKPAGPPRSVGKSVRELRSEEHTSELQSHSDLVCRLLLEKKKKPRNDRMTIGISDVFSETHGGYTTPSNVAGQRDI